MGMKATPKPGGGLGLPEVSAGVVRPPAWAALTFTETGSERHRAETVKSAAVHHLRPVAGSTAGPHAGMESSRVSSDLSTLQMTEE